MSNEQKDYQQKVKEFITNLPQEVLRKPTITPEINYSDNILPFELYRGTRQNIERIGDQINKSFCFEIFDGCSVLIRRLIEMLLILSFIEHDIKAEIKGIDGNYLQLSGIVSKAINSTTLDLSRSAKKYLEIFREKGNLSAHNPFHNARKRDLEIVQYKFRHLVEELLYKAQILK